MHSLKVSLPKILTDCKGDIVAVETLDNHNFNQVIKIHTTSGNIFTPCTFRYQALRRAPHSVLFSSMRHKLNLDGKTSDKTKLRESLQNNNRPALFRSIKVIKENTETRLQIRGDCGDMTTKCNVGPLDRILEQKNDISGKIGKIKIKSVLWLILLCRC